MKIEISKYNCNLNEERNFTQGLYDYKPKFIALAVLSCEGGWQRSEFFGLKAQTHSEATQEIARSIYFQKGYIYGEGETQWSRHGKDATWILDCVTLIQVAEYSDLREKVLEIQDGIWAGLVDKECKDRQAQRDERDRAKYQELKKRFEPAP